MATVPQSLIVDLGNSDLVHELGFVVLPSRHRDTTCFGLTETVDPPHGGDTTVLLGLPQTGVESRGGCTRVMERRH
jgi:hypothetical protein